MKGYNVSLKHITLPGHVSVFIFYKAGFELIFFTNIRVVALSGLAFILSFRGCICFVIHYAAI
jgi:hypothetical protein